MRATPLWKTLRNRLAFLWYGLLSEVVSVKKIRVSSGVLRLHTGTANEVHRAATFFSKEPETLAWIDQFRRKVPNGTIVLFDIGANVGVYSIYAGIQTPGIEIYAFEPDAQSFASLCKNVKSNRSPILPYQLALAQKMGLGKLMASSMDAGAGASALGEKYRFLKVADESIFVQGVFHCTLDDAVFQFGLPVPNFVKIDVDGLEREILNGARRVLGSEALKGLLVELQYQTESELHAVFAELESSGLVLDGMSDWIESSFNGSNSRNFLFARRA